MHRKEDMSKNLFNLLAHKTRSLDASYKLDLQLILIEHIVPPSPILRKAADQFCVQLAG